MIKKLLALLLILTLAFCLVAYTDNDNNPDNGDGNTDVGDNGGDNTDDGGNDGDADNEVPVFPSDDPVEGPIVPWHMD